MKALLLLIFVAGASFAEGGPGAKRIMTDDEYLAALMKEAESLQTMPIKDDARSRLYFLDKRMVRICPKEAQALPCSLYMKANPIRFGRDDTGYFQTDHWLTSQKVPDPKAHGDYELDQILLFLQEERAGGLAPIRILEPFQTRLRDWLKKYPSHPRLSEAVATESSLGREIKWKRSNKDPNAIYQP
jgi:hypothetical protein